jgi:hypothetical protein
MMTADERDQQVLELAATAAEWRTEAAYRIPAASRPGVYYLTTRHFCTCKDSFVRHSDRPCKHRAAVALLEQAVSQPCDALVLERLPSGEYAWLRPRAGMTGAEA